MESEVFTLGDIFTEKQSQDALSIITNFAASTRRHERLRVEIVGPHMARINTVAGPEKKLRVLSGARTDARSGTMNVQGKQVGMTALQQFVATVRRLESNYEKLPSNIDCTFGGEFFVQLAKELGAVTRLKGIDKPLLVGPQILSEELAQLADELHRQGRDAHVQKKLRQAARALRYDHVYASTPEVKFTV